MRLHRLRISAFGPFADPVDLDFEVLNDAGLFLLTGSNGAGKSSILDAVCFALYGAVPGERNSARRFRSDHAGPGEAPMVELEAGFPDGTYRIVRSAAWERPKRRGSGTTSQQSTVSVSRRAGDGWQPVTNRLDEAGQLITRLVGMNLTQFCQVVILPQGRFQAFLQSTATERQALLQQLFHTGRFQRVEAWLREHRLDLRRTSAEHEAAVGDVVNRISEVAGSPVPETDDDPLAWAAALHDETTRAQAAAVERLSSATADETRARNALEAGRDLAARLARLCTALGERESLHAQAGAIESLRLRVEAARLAARVAVLTPLVEAREAALEAATAVRAEAVDRLAAVVGTTPRDLTAEVASLRDAAHRYQALVPQADETEALRRELTAIAGAAVRAEAVDRLAAVVGTTPRDLTAEVASLRDAAHRYQALVPRADDAEELRRQLTAISGAIESAEARHRELEASDVAVVIAELSSRQEAVRAAQLALPEVRGAIDELRSRLRAHEQTETLTVTHAAAVAELAAVTSRALDAKEAWLAVREERIEGMAAELAGELAVGADCPVCGSLDHPHPARPHADAPDAEAERAALRAVDDAKALEHVHDQQVRELAATLEQSRKVAGDTSPAELLAGLEEHRLRARELAASVDAGASVTSALEAAVERRRGESTEDQRLRERAAVLRDRRDHVTSRLAVLDRELADALTGTSFADARKAYDETVALLTDVETAQRAEEDLAAAVRSLAEASGARSTAALEAGFGSIAEAEEALLSTSEVEAHARDLARHAARVSAVAELLADPALQDLEGVDVPEVAALESTHHEAEAARAAAAAEAETRRRGLARLGTLVAELTERHDAWGPVRRDLELATHLSAFCEGKSADNRWQIQLSAYVVAWRLSQVADAANLRLALMTHGRYSLEHTDLRGAGERRGGMTLVVRDDWTGVTRDPVTLSGGETFVVALALALGLADVITAEAGGASLQTLFVDEGFGMLDSTSLDLVMDTLDSLRESGRTVGVVSHVAEMRSRIPVQVQVHKPHDHGPSTVRVRA